MDQPYTKREQDEWRQDVKNQLDRIELQTTKTNGRVSKLERWQTGMIMCGALIITVVIPLIIYSYQLSFTDLKNQICNRVNCSQQ